MTTKDLEQIRQITKEVISEELKPIKSDIKKIKEDIAKIKEWVPTENSGKFPPRNFQTAPAA